MKTKFAFILVSLLLLNTCFGEHIRAKTITGRVIDYQARSVEGAKVIVYDSSYRKFDLLGRTRTTSNGRFSLHVETDTSMPFPNPYLIVGKPGLALGWKPIDGTCEYTIRLGKPGFFKGIVMDETGRPVLGANVRIFLTNTILSHLTISPLTSEEWFTTRTDAKGRFVFNNVPADSTADFGVEAPGRVSFWTFCEYGLGAGEQFAAGCTDIRITLSPEVRIQGRVIEKNTDHGIPNIPVEAISQNPSRGFFYKAPATTNPNGQFELTGLAPDRYLLRVNSDTRGSGHVIVNIKPVQTLSDVRIPLDKGIPFEVIVYNSKDETPVKNAWVQVIKDEQEFRYNGVFHQMATTDSNGLARLSVPPGECEVQAIKPGHGWIGPEKVRIRHGQMPRHEMFLPHTACVFSGEVVDERGHSLKGATVMQWPAGFSKMVTDANGLFDNREKLITRKPMPSRERVLVRHAPSGLGAIGMLRDPNKSGELRGRIVLKPAYTLMGRVIDSTGKRIPAASVELVDGVNIRPFYEVFTDAKGIYCIRPVPALEGNMQYAIVARAEGFGPTLIHRIPFHDDPAIPVHLDPIILRPSDQSISGTVEDANGHPVTGSVVKVYGPKLSESAEKRCCGMRLTDSQGRFRIAGVCKEPLEIIAESPPPQKERGFTWAYGGSENVRVVLGQKLIFSKSLSGKPLPAFEDIKINFNLKQAKGCKTLVCFFDKDQRPSRRCALKLAKQSKQLKHNGITIVAIQASKVDEDTLNEWLKINGIPFPVGIVQGDEEQIRFTWGIRSLPWLILTDEKHIVRAEGFSLDELDEKLNGNSH